MPVAFVNGDAGSAGSGGSANVTFAYTCGSGSDRLLTIQLWASATVNFVNYNGQGLTFHASGGSMGMWRRVAPATGSNTVQINMSNYQQALWSIADWTGVDQTTPLGTQVTASGSSTTPAVASVTCPPGGAVWGGMYAEYAVAPGTITATSGTLAGWTRDAANGRRKAGGYRLTTGTLAWSQTPSTSWSAQAVPINAAVSFTAKLPELHLQAVRRSVL